MEKANRILTGGYFYAGIFSRKREKGGRSMQIYSAMIPVKESFSKKEFVRWSWSGIREVRATG